MFTTEEAKPGTIIFIINKDGTGLHELANFEARKAIAAWTPDGGHVAVRILWDSEQPDEYFLLKVDESEEPIEVTGLPDSWFPWYWPLWGELE